MNGKDHQLICDTIAQISHYIRFAGIIGRNGNLLSNCRWGDLKPLLDPVEFVLEERKKVQTVAFAIKNKRVW